MEFNIGEFVYITNKNGQQKRSKIASNGFLMGDKIHYMVEASQIPINIDNISQVKKTETKAKKYNCTRLDVEQAFGRHIFHRDFFAHYMRWTHLLRYVNKDTKVLDFGCGEANLAITLWANRHIPAIYKGYEYAQTVVDKTRERLLDLKWVNIEQKDLTVDVEADEKYDAIVSFEVVEHIGVDNLDTYLQNMKKFGHKDTKYLISTPIYDHKIGAADNHIVDNEVNEFTKAELVEKLTENGFEIIEQYGTFASQKDYKDHLNEWQTEMYNELSKYYDVNILSILMAPLVPDYSRNVIYICKVS